ncbi:MAG TPA: FeoB-associated Cys-rich membrane protein [Chitinophagaceae bacterium]
MERSNIIILVRVGIALIALVVFLIWKNQKDKKLLNPDAPDSVEETHMDQKRRTDKI